MKMNRSALRSGLLIVAVTLSFNAIFTFAQIVSIGPTIGREQLPEVLSLLQQYSFEELPLGASSCPTAEQPAIPNPLVYDAVTIADATCISTRACGSEPRCQPNPNSITLILSDDGGKVVFPHTPNLAALEILYHSGFQLRVTDGNGETLEMEAGPVPLATSISKWAFQASAGIAMIELFDFGPNQLASVFVETTPAPPLSPGLLSARAISPNAVELTWTDYSLVEHGFLVERKVGAEGPWEVRGSVGPNVTTAVLVDLEPTTQYFFRVRAINDAGYSLYSNEATATTMTQFTVTFQSSPGADGFVVERSEHANIGQTAVAGLEGAGALRAGDTAANQQYKAFVSFNTRAIPNDAIVRSAKLKLKRGMIVGTNPFLTHGLCLVDMKGGAGFSGQPVLQASDFQAPAHQRFVGVLNNAPGGMSEAVIALNALGLVNKIGATQFRIYFKTDDNNDKSEDWIGWYSSDNPEPLNRPGLEVTYWH